MLFLFVICYFDYLLIIKKILFKRQKLLKCIFFPVYFNFKVNSSKNMCIFFSIKMNIVTLILFWTVCFMGVYAGSECPPRLQIYPCVCINMRLSKRHLHTTVMCQGLKNTNHLKNLLPIFSNIDIDRFHLYDSFWNASADQTALPNDWFSLMKIKEFEIHDSKLESCFACHWTMRCNNIVTTAFKVINSTTSESICTLCDVENEVRSPLLSCLSKLETFALTRGALKAITTSFFPLTLRELKTLDLSNNQIRAIDQNVFRNVPKLKSLDLSHNAIERIDHAFGQKTVLEYIDLSYNKLKTIGRDLAPLLPVIKSLNFAENSITEFRQIDYRVKPPRSLWKIDLTGNPLNCECSLIWVNKTFAVGVNILGTCVSPEDYNGSRIRVTSRNLSERCTSNGELGTRRPST